MIYVETENFARIDNEWDDTGCDKNGYKQGRNWVETSPAIKLNQ